MWSISTNTVDVNDLWLYFCKKKYETNPEMQFQQLYPKTPGFDAKLVFAPQNFGFRLKDVDMSFFRLYLLAYFSEYFLEQFYEQ